jgi:LacI family transcriptional regulator
MLSAETVQNVIAVADALGYVPNHTARALSTGRYANVALIVPDVANPFFPPLIQAAQMEADRFGFCVFLGNSGEDARQEDKLVARFSGQVEGLVLASSRLSEERIRRHAERRPLVLINRDVSGIPRVLIDSGRGVAQAVAHLAALGHEKICYVSGPPTSWSNRQRRAAVKRAAARLHMEVCILPSSMPTHDAGRAVAPSLLASGASAVIAFDDLLAQGILAGLAAENISVPRAVSVIGCDDVLGATTHPPLTTVSNRSHDAGRVALSLLIEALRTHAIADVRHTLETHLVVRKTTAPFRSSKGATRAARLRPAAAISAG